MFTTLNLSLQHNLGLQPVNLSLQGCKPRFGAANIGLETVNLGLEMQT